jgi:hypothetical protein
MFLDIFRYESSTVQSTVNIETVSGVILHRISTRYLKYPEYRILRRVRKDLAKKGTPDNSIYGILYMNKEKIVIFKNKDRPRYMGVIRNSGSFNASIFHTMSQDYDIIKYYVNYPYRFRLPNDKKLMSICSEYISNQFRDCKSLMKKAVFNDGYILRYVSDRLKRCRKIVQLAIKNNTFNLKYAYVSLKNDYTLIKYAITINGESLKMMSDSIRDNKKMVKLALRTCPDAIEHASLRIRDDYNIMKWLVKKDGKLIRFASDRLKDMCDLCSIAVLHSSTALSYVSDRLRDDHRIKALPAMPDSCW